MQRLKEFRGVAVRLWLGVAAVGVVALLLASGARASGLAVSVPRPDAAVGFSQRTAGGGVARAGVRVLPVRVASAGAVRRAVLVSSVPRRVVLVSSASRRVGSGLRPRSAGVVGVRAVPRADRSGSVVVVGVSGGVRVRRVAGGRVGVRVLRGPDRRLVVRASPGGRRAGRGGRGARGAVAGAGSVRGVVFGHRVSLSLGRGRAVSAGWVASGPRAVVAVSVPARVLSGPAASAHRAPVRVHRRARRSRRAAGGTVEVSPVPVSGSVGPAGAAGAAGAGGGGVGAGPAIGLFGAAVVWLLGGLLAGRLALEFLPWRSTPAALPPERPG